MHAMYPQNLLLAIIFVIQTFFILPTSSAMICYSQKANSTTPTLEYAAAEFFFFEVNFPEYNCMNYTFACTAVNAFCRQSDVDAKSNMTMYSTILTTACSGLKAANSSIPSSSDQQVSLANVNCCGSNYCNAPLGAFNNLMYDNTVKTSASRIRTSVITPLVMIMLGLVSLVL